MNLRKPINENYCGTVVKIKNIIPIENCQNVCHTNIFGNLIIVSKETKIGDIGIFFPVETKLSNEFLKNNNLYSKSELNKDQTKKGYFSENGRIRCQKFRGNSSMGFWIPILSIDFVYTEYSKNDIFNLEENDCFDELNGIKICEKYIVKQYNQSSTSKGSRYNKKLKKISCLVDNQFKFHIDTQQLGKNLDRLNPEDFIQISQKMHGTSCISSNILCKRKLNILEKVLKFIGVKIHDIEYKNIYSSRKVLKNDSINKSANHFYKEDIWGNANSKLKDLLQKGMTIYYEIVGYLSNGGYIQKDYDYNCNPGEFDIYIYRITQTNEDGKVFEFSAKKVQQWCKTNGLKAVIELYYGKIIDLYDMLKSKHNTLYNNLIYSQNKNINEYYSDIFLELLRAEYLEKKCNICKNDVPAEGIVLRIEKLDIECYKFKSELFYERETKQLDSNEVDIESEN